MRVTILLAAILFVDIFAADQELKTEDRAASTISTNTKDDAADADLKIRQAMQAQFRQLQAKTATLSARKDNLLREHDQKFSSLDRQRKKALQELEDWFTKEKEKKLVTIQIQLLDYDARERQAKSNFQFFINGNPKADVRRENFDLQLYLGQIERERRILIGSICGDLCSENDSRQKNIQAHFETLKSAQIETYNTENAQLERGLLALQIRLFALQVELSEVDNSMQING